MLRDERVDVAPTWAQEATSVGYREIDRQLRSIAKRRAGLDVEEARWLREAAKLRIWRKLGFSTVLEYLEDVFGYAPRTAMERLRVAKELGELRGLEEELRHGRMSWSAAKELSRVMTPATEAAWLARARGKNLRDIEELVAGRKKGDEPDAPQDPQLMTRTFVVELPPRVDALVQQCRAAAADELGHHIEDVDLIEMLCRAFLQPSAANGKPPQPAHRVVIHRCDDCNRAWQDSRGRRVPIEADATRLAECDADLVDEDGKTAKSIPQRIRKQVWARDRGRCRVPGCRAARKLGPSSTPARRSFVDFGPRARRAALRTRWQAVVAGSDRGRQAFAFAFAGASRCGGRGGRSERGKRRECGARGARGERGLKIEADTLRRSRGVRASETRARGPRLQGPRRASSIARGPRPRGRRLQRRVACEGGARTRRNRAD